MFSLGNRAFGSYNDISKSLSTLGGVFINTYCHVLSIFEFFRSQQVFLISCLC